MNPWETFTFYGSISTKTREARVLLFWIGLLVDIESARKEQVAAAVHVCEEGAVEGCRECAAEDTGRADGADDGALGAAAHGAAHVELGGGETPGRAGDDKGAERREVHGVDGVLGGGGCVLQRAGEGGGAAGCGRACREQRDADGCGERVLHGGERVGRGGVCGREVAARDAEDALELVDRPERVKDGVVLCHARACTRVCSPCVASACVQCSHSSAERWGDEERKGKEKEKVAPFLSF